MDTGCQEDGCEVRTRAIPPRHPPRTLAGTGSPASRRPPRWVGPTYVALAGCLLAWIIWPGVSLPTRIAPARFGEPGTHPGGDADGARCATPTPNRILDRRPSSVVALAGGDLPRDRPGRARPRRRFRSRVLLPGRGQDLRRPLRAGPVRARTGLSDPGGRRRRPRRPTGGAADRAPGRPARRRRSRRGTTAPRRGGVRGRRGGGHPRPADPLDAARPGAAGARRGRAGRGQPTAGRGPAGPGPPPAVGSRGGRAHRAAPEPRGRGTATRRLPVSPRRGHTSGVGGGDGGPRDTALGHTLLVLATTVPVAAALVLRTARRAYPRDVATALATPTQPHGGHP